MSRRNAGVLFALSAVFVSCLAWSWGFLEQGARAQTTEPPVVSLAPHVSGLAQPVGITHAGDGSGRLFILEQAGRIRIFKNGALLAAPFLDLTGRISAGGEQGLLGLAFPPGFASKGYFYVNYTAPSSSGSAGDTVIARFQVSPTNPDLADSASEQRVLVVPQPFDNHNGGHLAFGPRDRLFYAALGDGGSFNDPDGRAQNPAELLGKMLRLDVETGRPYTYTVPPSNPFVGRAGTRPEIWASGLRNPWRFSFDRLTADLFIGDVGQGGVEEIDFQPAPSPGGENYGWDIMEGFNCFDPNPCSMAGLTLPILQYANAGSDNCAVTGGYVYRGTFPRLRGRYVYGDYCSGRIWALTRSDGAWSNVLLLDTNFNLSTFGEDEAGNLYVASHNTGQIFEVVDSAARETPTPAPNAFISFTTGVHSVNEGAGLIDIVVIRSTNIETDVSVSYFTFNNSASDRTDYTPARGRLRFAPGETQKSFRVLITDDQRDEGLTESFLVGLEHPTPGVELVTPPTSVVDIFDNEGVTAPENPVDRSEFFVRQHYFDFLNRFPDAAGEAFWVANIEKCGADAGCREVRRVDTSAAFFLSIESQETGYFVYRTHKAAFSNLAGKPVPVVFRDYLADTQQIGRGVEVGVGDWAGQLEANKRGYLDDFVRREAFLALYPTGQTPAAYVDALNQNAGHPLPPAERDDLVSRLADGRETRATALRRVAEHATLRAAEFNRAFVLMQYFGYLRRNPDDAPDTNFDGWRFWLDKLEANGGDFRRAEMVRAFIESIEYRQRSGLFAS